MMSSQAPLPLIPWSMGLYLPKMGHMDWDTKFNRKGEMPRMGKLLKEGLEKFSQYIS